LNRKQLQGSADTENLISCSGCTSYFPGICAENFVTIPPDYVDCLVRPALHEYIKTVAAVQRLQY